MTNGRYSNPFGNSLYMKTRLSHNTVIYTFIEIVITLSILAVLSTASIGGISDSSQLIAVERDVSMLRSALYEVRSSAMADDVNATAYSLRIQMRDNKPALLVQNHKGATTSHIKLTSSVVCTSHAALQTGFTISFDESGAPVDRAGQRLNRPVIICCTTSLTTQDHLTRYIVIYPFTGFIEMRTAPV